MAHFVAPPLRQIFAGPRWLSAVNLRLRRAARGEKVLSVPSSGCPSLPAIDVPNAPIYFHAPTRWFHLGGNHGGGRGDRPPGGNRHPGVCAGPAALAGGA